MIYGCRWVWGLSNKRLTEIELEHRSELNKEAATDVVASVIWEESDENSMYEDIDDFSFLKEKCTKPG